VNRVQRCALFVDFDNVYLGLQRLDPDAAASFAEEPGRWLAALEEGEDAEGHFRRRFLVRSCYLNPSAFSQFRANFTRAGFQVVDCPSLTQQGKSSADINLVLDAVDALAAPVRYEEFVIVSADADFTPLALRCRAADRRVTVVTASPAASAYRAVADQVVAADELAALLRGQERPEPPAAPAQRREVDLAPLQRQVTAVTDVPGLRGEHYEVLLRSLAEDLRARPFDREATTKRVYEACQAADASVGRSTVKQVVDGLLYAGLDLSARPALRRIAETWAEHVVGLCRGARVELSRQDVAALRRWVTGGLVKG